MSTWLNRLLWFTVGALAVYCLVAIGGCAAARGVVATYTGNSPIVEVAPNIFICNRYQVNEDLKTLRPGKIAVLNVAAEIDDTPIPGVLMVKVGIEEKDNADTERQLGRATNKLKSLLRQGYIVVVHCWFGENRTPWVIAHYLADTGNLQDTVLLMFPSHTWQAEFAKIQLLRPECYIKDWMF